jgi:hypothetical protein
VSARDCLFLCVCVNLIRAKVIPVAAVFNKALHYTTPGVPHVGVYVNENT